MRSSNRRVPGWSVVVSVAPPGSQVAVSSIVSATWSIRRENSILVRPSQESRSSRNQSSSSARRHGTADAVGTDWAMRTNRLSSWPSDGVHGRTRKGVLIALLQPAASTAAATATRTATPPHIGARMPTTITVSGTDGDHQRGDQRNPAHGPPLDRDRAWPLGQQVR
jgi:hypothetical protein